VGDSIGLAFSRERKARRWPVWQPDFVRMRHHKFKCVCCGPNRLRENGASRKRGLRPLCAGGGLSEWTADDTD
jgi:hypothetical protein